MGQLMWEKKITTLLWNHITEIKLMKVYNMTILAKDCHVKLNGESVYLHVQNVTEYLTNSCMFANE